MKLRDRFRVLLGDPQPILEAAAGLVTTPNPGLLDDYKSLIDPRQLLRVTQPSPEMVEALFQESHELGATAKSFRNQVWRQGVIVQGAFGYRCDQCGFTTDEVPEEGACEGCNASGDHVRPPDQEQRNAAEQLVREVNRLGQGIEDLGRLLEDDANKHGNTYVVLRWSFVLDPNGIIISMRFHEARRGDARYFGIVADDAGNLGGKYFICLRCRGQSRYEPEKTSAPCHACGGATYDAWFVEESSGSSGGRLVRRNYYLPVEVKWEEDWHYPTGRGGLSPAQKLWHKAIALLWMDRYVSYAFDPRRDKRPEKILVTIGGDEKSIEKWAAADAARRAKNPYAISHLHIPVIGLGGEAKADAKVIDLGDAVIKGQSMDLRKKFEQSIWAEYGVMPIQMSDVAGGGGLNNEGLQVRVGSQVVAFHHRLHEQWIRTVLQAKGVSDWVIVFPPPMEEDEGREADVKLKDLDVAVKASREAGLQVEWAQGKPKIHDGSVTARAPANPFPPPPPGGGPEPPSVDKPQGQVPQVEQAAPTSSKQEPKRIQAVFSGPSGAAAAQDVLFEDPFAGLDQPVSELIRGEVAQSLSQPQGWSVESIVDRIQPFLERAGVENAAARARTIVRVETNAAISEWKLRIYAAEEAAREERFRYVMRGADDARTTKLSYWVRDQVGQGVPMDRLVAVIEEGIGRAVRGDFDRTGALSGTRGQPIRLPTGFKRRGTLAHFNDRDIVVRVVE